MSEKLTCPYCGGDKTRKRQGATNIYRCDPCERWWTEHGKITIETDRIRALERENAKLRERAGVMRN